MQIIANGTSLITTDGCDRPERANALDHNQDVASGNFPPRTFYRMARSIAGITDEVLQIG